MRGGERQRRPALSAALLVLLAFTLLGHICVLPLHGHPHEDATIPYETDADHDSDQSVHAASCELIRSTSPVSSYTVLVATPLIHDYVAGTVQAARLTPRSPSVNSPPLFLLHVSLLI